MEELINEIIQTTKSTAEFFDLEETGMKKIATSPVRRLSKFYLKAKTELREI